MGSREDDAWWDNKYAEASCHEHGEDGMWYDSYSGEWKCDYCIDESHDDEYDDNQEANEEAYKYG